jgi:cell division protein FtsW
VYEKHKVDKYFLIVTLTLILLGFFLFVSASLGLLARDGGAKFSSVAFNQTFFGLLGGGVAMYLTSKINYSFWKKYSLYFFLFSIFMTLLVFIPGIGFSAGGATRWISLGPLPSFQPVEFLKLGFVIYFAAWISGVRQKVTSFQFGMLPLLVILAVVGGILLAQPDTDSFMIIAIAGLSMFVVSGGSWRDLLISCVIGAILFGSLVLSRDYLKDRILTYIDPSRDPLGKSYQLEQSLIAIGSGGVFGRGFGQSVQKFNYLPEPIGDSIFAVAAEEWGFFGSSVLILLFLAFALRGLKIAASSKDIFGGMMATGIVMMITIQSLINISSMLGLFPLSGTPLLFVSHGGTALLFTMAEAGIVLNISKSSGV